MHQNSVSQKLADGQAHIPFTREQIAQRLGTTRETVTRYLKKLKTSKLIDIKPQQIVVLNKAGLQKILT